MAHPAPSPFVLLAALLAAAPLSAQRMGCFRGVMPQLAAARTEADSTALAEAFLAHPPQGKEACGKLVAGYVLALTSSAAESDWPARQRARELIDAALRGNEGEPRLYFATGILLMHASAYFDGMRMLDRAKGQLSHADPAFQPHELAVMHYLYALRDEGEWRDARSEGDLMSTAQGNLTCPSMETAPGVDPTFDAFFYICSTTWDEVMRQFYRHWQEELRPVYGDMVSEFEAAIRAEPTWHDPSSRLLAEYVYARDYIPALDLIRRLTKAQPDDPDVLAVSAAIYHQTGRDSLAQLLFDRAFSRMSADDRRVYEDIRPLLAKDDSARFVAADSTTANAARDAFWNAEDPLYLTSWNERRLEHYARVATVDAMFGVATLKQRGWDTDAGQIWIRYGRPRDIYEFRSEGDIQIGGRDSYWVYDSHGLRFSFHRNLGSARYRFGDFGQTHSEELKASLPERGAAFFADSAETLDRQVVRILGPDDQPQVLVYAPWPEEFQSDTRVGLTLLDADFRKVAQWTANRPRRDGISAELDGLKPGAFEMALELWDPAYRRLARVRDTVTVTSFAGALTASDILLATRVQPRGSARPESRADLTITPTFGLSIPARRPFGLYWEIYGLTPDSSGVRRYAVSLEVKRGGGGLPVRVLRGLSGLFGGNPTTTVRYVGTALGARALEWLALDGVRSPGEFSVTITITDEITQATTVTRRSFRAQ